jgi:hypothetical protein
VGVPFEGLLQWACWIAGAAHLRQIKVVARLRRRQRRCADKSADRRSECCYSVGARLCACGGGLAFARCLTTLGGVGGRAGGRTERRE